MEYAFPAKANNFLNLIMIQWYDLNKIAIVLRKLVSIIIFLSY